MSDTYLIEMADGNLVFGTLVTDHPTGGQFKGMPEEYPNFLLGDGTYYSCHISRVHRANTQD